MPLTIISGKKFSYSIIRKPIRSLSLRICGRRTFTVSSPQLLPNFLITRFISQHEEWIITNSAKFCKKVLLKNLKSLRILDETYEFIVKKTVRDSVVIFRDEHKIYANSVSLLNSHLKKLIDVKFRPLALTLINLELHALTQKYNFTYHRVSIKNTTSRFGSCSSTNNLNFNWQIIFLPVDIFRHIILHELTHTIHHNHSTKFWNQLAEYDPSWRANRRYLKTQGQKHFIV